MAISGPGPSPPQYIIIGTDYETYSVVYSCCYASQRKYLWLLTREPVISDALYDQMLGIAKKSLPKFNFDDLVGREIQGDMCSYATTTTS